MGVSFYSCSACDEAVYEEYIRWCETCSNRICDECHNGELTDDGEVTEDSCPHCSGEIEDPWDILNYLFDQHLERNREEIMKEYEVHRAMERGK